MDPFSRLTAIAAPLPLANIDTDKILAGRFLKTIRRDGLGSSLFSALRDNPDFVLNRAPWNQAGILITLENFGCGSSREHAPWALLDFGIRCVIAPSIADIFYNNCFKNGILPIVLARSLVDDLMVLAANEATATMAVDLATETIETAEGTHRFMVDPKRRSDLLNGIDDIARSLGHVQSIAAWEECRKVREPWFQPVDSAALKNAEYFV